MGLAVALCDLDFQRCLELGAFCKRDFEAATDESAIDPADRIVGAEHGKTGDRRTVEQTLGIGARRYAFGKALEVSLAVAHRKHRRAWDDGIDPVGKGRRIGGRHRAQQRPQIRIVPGLDAPRRQAGRLQLVYQRIA
ncbi:hypothetical protein ABIA15_001952 [Sinorhizobium fredii]